MRALHGALFYPPKPSRFTQHRLCVRRVATTIPAQYTLFLRGIHMRITPANRMGRVQRAFGLLEVGSNLPFHNENAQKSSVYLPTCPTKNFGNLIFQTLRSHRLESIPHTEPYRAIRLGPHTAMALPHLTSGRSQ